MATPEFRLMIAAETQKWLARHESKIDLLLSRVTEAMVPVILESVERNLLLTTGTLTPNERERVSVLLQRSALMLARFAPGKLDAMSEVDALRQELDSYVRQISEGWTETTDMTEA